MSKTITIEELDCDKIQIEFLNKDGLFLKVFEIDLHDESFKSYRQPLIMRIKKKDTEEQK